jgi:hypothetical protein
LSRHRKIPLRRSKAIVLATAGVLSVATAASATAATWPHGAAAGSNGRAGISAGGTRQAAGAPRLTVTDQLAQPKAQIADQQSSVTMAQRAYQVRLAGTQEAITQWQAAQWQSARRRAAEQAAKKAAAAVAQARAQQAAAAQSPAMAQPSQAGTATVPAGTATVPAASGSPQHIAEAMLGSFGWSSSQFSCLDPLWAHESGWSVSAYNAGSGAFGIPQALPGSRMASAGPDWQTNAATQIRWGLEYIKGTYRSPCGAWDHEKATGWY